LFCQAIKLSTGISNSFRMEGQAAVSAWYSPEPTETPKEHPVKKRIQKSVQTPLSLLEIMQANLSGKLFFFCSTRLELRV
jgi:hypothetical protein